jgi:hypothetical protein
MPLPAERLQLLDATEGFRVHPIPALVRLHASVAEMPQLPADQRVHGCAAAPHDADAQQGDEGLDEEGKAHEGRRDNAARQQRRTGPQHARHDLQGLGKHVLAELRGMVQQEICVRFLEVALHQANGDRVPDVVHETDPRLHRERRHDIHEDHDQQHGEAGGLHEARDARELQRRIDPAQCGVAFDDSGIGRNAQKRKHGSDTEQLEERRNQHEQQHDDGPTSLLSREQVVHHPQDDRHENAAPSPARHFDSTSRAIVADGSATVGNSSR